LIETQRTPVDAAPTADDYVVGGSRRMVQLAMGSVVLSGILAFAYIFAFHAATIIAPLVVLLALATPVLFYRYPRLGASTVVAAVCLFEILPTTWPDAVTDKIPYFWNINTIVQSYTQADFHALPVNVFELFLIVIASTSLLRSVYTKTVSVRIGRLFWPIVAYLCFVAYGWIHGITTGGDFKISLQEVRSQFYFLVAYLLAVNAVRDQKDLTRMQWIMVLTIALKGILYTVRRLRFINFGGMVMPDQGVGSHEEAFFFDCFVIMLVVFLLCKVYPRLRTVMWVLLPFVVLGDLACNRRAATAAFIVVIPVLLLVAYRGLPSRRKLVLGIGLSALVGLALYYPSFKDRAGALAEPARAIQSQFAPGARDKSSDDYRIAEEADLYATIKAEPLLGYGYGKPMFHVAPIADISAEYPWWDIMTHNQILWIWMRVGTLGFVVFWLMIVSIVFYATGMLRAEASTPEIKAGAMLALLTTCSLLIFGLLDLQLSNFRDMLFSGFWIGILAALPRMTTTADSDARRPGAVR